VKLLTNKCRTLVFIALATLGLSTITASAVPISIVNQGFEDPTTTTFGALPTGWVRTGGTDAGVFRPSSSPSSGTGFTTGVIGGQTAFSNGPDFSQTLTEQLQIGTYTLTVAVGDRDDTAFPNHAIRLLAGSTLITQAFNAPVANDGWLDISASVTINAGNTLIGSLLAIQLINNGGIQINWDNVRLDGPGTSVGVVPLPAALPLFGTGLAVMGFVGWRRKRKTVAAV